MKYFILWLLNLYTLAHAGDLVATTFAGKELLKNCTAVSVDHDGTVYVTETARRKGGEWSEGPRELSYGFNTVAEKRAWLEANPEAKLQGAQDNNKDGKVNAADLTTNGEVIHWLRDTNGDGVADEHAIVTDQFKDKMDGVAGGILARNGQLWVTCFPTLWKLEQTGVRKPLVSGFAVKIGQRGHDLHGLRMGPYGRLYWTLGDRGLHVEQDGKTFHYPYHGAMVRCEPDGSNFEVFAHGLRNPVEIAFDDFGNWVAPDNDGDMKGELERLVHIVEGSDHGWRRNWQFQRRYNPWLAEKLSVPWHEGQAAHITPTIHNLNGGPCGFTYEPGTAWNDDWRKAFILCYAPNTRLDALWLKPKGASFELDRTKRLPAKGCPSGINFGPDGALYLADWGGGWNRDDRGGVIKIDDPESAASTIRKETATLLAKLPSDPDRLVNLLSHPDQRVRLEAQYTLANAQAVKDLRVLALKAKAPRIGRIHAIWGLAQAHRKIPLTDVDFLKDLLKEAHPELRNQAAKACREIGHPSLAASLAACLGDEPRIQMHAMMALGRCGNASHLPAIQDVLGATDDPFVRHAAVLAMTELGTPASLSELARHPNTRVRIGAVVALRRLKSPEVGIFMKDPDLLVLREAARAIHDDGGIPAALPALASCDRSALQDEAIGRRVLNANVRFGDHASALRLAAFANNPNHATVLRREALDCLNTWAKPATYDRVNGRLVHDPAGLLVNAQEAVVQLAALLNDPDEGIRSAMAKLSKTHDVRFYEGVYLKWLAEGSSDLKIAALNMLASAKQVDALHQGIQDSDPAVNATAIGLLANTHAREAVTALDAKLTTRDATALARFYRLLGNWPDDSANLVLQKQMERSDIPPEVRFELHEAAMKRELTKDPFPDALLISGGDAEKGQVLFNEHSVAQCIRCHRAGPGPGSEFGPDLSTVGERLKPQEILESMLEPNAQIAEGFALASLETAKGIYAGNIVKEDTRSVTLADAAGKKAVVQLADVIKRSEHKISIMPPMKGILQPGELRDIRAYLETLK